MYGLVAFNYQKRLDDLATPSWLVDTFRRHLDADPWPPSDEAQRQPIGTGSSRAGEGAGQVGVAHPPFEVSEVFRW